MGNLYFTHRVRASLILKVLGILGVISLLGAVIGAALLGRLTGPSPQTPADGRPPYPATTSYQPTPDVTDVSETATTATEPTTEPTVAPSTSRPEASASESSDTSDCAGWVIAKFGGGNEGSYFVLVPKEDDDKPSQRKLAENVLRDPDNVPSYIPYASDTFTVPVSKAAYNSYRQFAWYPCDADAISSSTGK